MKKNSMAKRVACSYVSNMPEVTNNAYNYFNYDHRIIEKSMDRGDPKIPYYTASDFTDAHYEELAQNAMSRVNPILAKYDGRVAIEDALTTAIRDFRNGFYDGKINANAYSVFVEALMHPQVMQVVMAKKKKKEEEEPKSTEKVVILQPKQRKQLKEMFPMSEKGKRQRVQLFTKPGKPELHIEKRSNENINSKEECSMSFNVKAFTESLDAIATEVEALDPRLALEIDKVSDVLEGRREASTLKFDADEAAYMADRFNNKVRSRNADEPYMDKYNENDFSQVSKAYAQMPGHASSAAMPAAAPAAAPAPEEEGEVEASKKASRPYRKL